MMMNNQRLKIAIQKKGRLNEESLDIFRRSGLKLLPSKSTLFYSSENLPIDILLVRDDDIPTLVQDNICDLGIVGENLLQEQKNKQKLVCELKLPFGRCRLSIASPKDKLIENIRELENKRIATSYPNLLTDFLKKNEINAQVVEFSGSVEIAPSIGVAELICDLVSTGKTLEENNLVETLIVLESQAVLVKSQFGFSSQKQKILEILLSRIKGVLKAQESKYILFHAPKSSLNDIKAVLPGCEFPTVVPLYGNPEMVAVHVVAQESVFWSTLEALKMAGSSAILVLPIEKMML